MKKILLAAVSAAAIMSLGVASANAQSLEGAYAGAAGGYGVGVVELSDPSGVITGSQEIGAHGLDGTIFAGYGTTFENVYVGIEGQLGYSGVEHNTTVGGGNMSTRVKENAALYGRLGFSFSESSLLYGIAGLSVANYEVTAGATSEERGITSYKIGAGLEQAVSENMFARASVDFDISRDVETFGGVNFRPVTSVARLGLGFRF